MFVSHLNMHESSARLLGPFSHPFPTVGKANKYRNRVPKPYTNCKRRNQNRLITDVKHLASNTPHNLETYQVYRNIIIITIIIVIIIIIIIIIIMFNRRIFALKMNYNVFTRFGKLQKNVIGTGFTE